MQNLLMVQNFGGNNNEEGSQRIEKGPQNIEFFEKITHKIPYKHMQSNMYGENQPPVPTPACHHCSGQKFWSLCG